MKIKIKLFGKKSKSGEWAISIKKDNTEKEWEQGEEQPQRNQMIPLRFQTGGRHQTSPVSLWGKNSKRKNMYNS